MGVIVTGRSRVWRGSGTVRVVRASEDAISRAEVLAVGAIVVVALLLRLRGLATFPYIEDELYTLVESTELFGTQYKPGIDARPLYYLLQHALLWVLPPVPATLRLMPIVFGVLGVFVTWLLGRRALGPTAGIVGALLAAISPWHMFASGMARYWSLVYLLAALAFLLVPRACEVDRPRPYLVALAVLVAGTLTHPTFVFPVVGLALALTLVREEGPVRWHPPSRRALAWLWLPYAAVLAIELAVLGTVGREPVVLTLGGRGMGARLMLMPGVIEWMTPVVFAAGALGALALFASGESWARRWGAMATLGATATLGALVAASLVTEAYVDYGMAMLPLVFVSAGGLIELGARVVRAGRERWFARIATMVLVAGVLASTVSHLADGTRYDPRPAFARIERERPDILVLTVPIIMQRAYAPQLRARELSANTTQLDSLLTAERDFWVVSPSKREGSILPNGAELVAWLGERCHLAEAHERRRLDYRRYRVELWRCTRVEPVGATTATR